MIITSKWIARFVKKYTLVLIYTLDLIYTLVLIYIHPFYIYMLSLLYVFLLDVIIWKQHRRDRFIKTILSP